MKVYALTSGSYSNYHIDAITLDKNRAEEIQKMFRCEIEEYDTDDIPQIITKDPIWFCRMATDKELLIYKEDLDPYYLCSLGKISSKRKGIYYSYIQAPTKKKAEKIFYDKLAEYKAQEANLC